MPEAPGPTISASAAAASTASASTGDVILVLLVLCGAVVLVWQASWICVRLLAKAVDSLPHNPFLSRTWARAHPVRALLQERLPRLYGFLRHRLTPRRFDGLPLTLLVAAAGYLVLLLGGLIEEVAEKEEIVAFDQSVSTLFDAFRGTFLLPIVMWVTDLGAQPALVAVSIVSTGFLWADRRPGYILPLWVTIAGAQATTWVGKFGFDRARPDFLTPETAFSPSFPSAHATGAVAVYGFIAYAIARDMTSPRQRFEIAFWTGVLVSTIAGSRVFLTVHFASDVAAGILVGCFWLLAGFTIAEFMKLRSAAKFEGDAPRQAE
jgi:membrane-associated phospholipid phosphatase